MHNILIPFQILIAAFVLVALLSRVLSRLSKRGSFRMEALSSGKRTSFIAFTSIVILLVAYLITKPPYLWIVIFYIFLFLCLPYYLYRLGKWSWSHIKQMRPRKKALAIGIILLIGISCGYEAYTALYPTDSYYENEFRDITRVPYPASGKIIFKDATLPDLHGDHSACALIEVSPDDYNRLLKQIPSVKLDTMDRLGSAPEDKLFKQYGQLSMASETWRTTADDKYFYWGCVEGKPWIEIHYCRW